MTTRRQRIAILIACVGVLLALVVAGAVYERRPQFFPFVVLQSAEPLQIQFLQRPVATHKSCEARVKLVADTLRAQCPACSVIEERCLEKLDPIQRKFLHGQPVNVPTMRIPEGAIAFISTMPEVALKSCLDAATETQRQLPGRRDCSVAGFESLQLSVADATRGATSGPLPGGLAMALIALVGAAAAFGVCFLVVRYPRWHEWFSHDLVETGPQKFHVTPTPRIGGLALVAALAASVAAADAFGWIRQTAVDGLIMLSLAAIPAFAGGFGEDVTKRVSVAARLMLTISGGVIASLLVGASLDRVDVPGLDTLLIRWPIFAIAFTAFAVGGVANAVNIIDGYNGLVSGYAILVLAALAYVAYQVGDPVVLAASLAMLGGLVGFLFWNFPKGHIFLGDGGAYLLGFWLAELAVLLVARNPAVSPWFPMALLAYPVFETFFSVYRKKFLRGHSPGHPDGLHFHMLVYKRLVRFSVGSRSTADVTSRNSAVAKYIWAASAALIALALGLWHETLALVGLASLFCAAYVWLYMRIAHWRTPRWMITARD